MFQSDRDLAAWRGIDPVPVITDSGTFTAIFDNGYLLAGESGEQVPKFELPTVDVAKYGLRTGITVTIGGKGYKVRRHEPDGTGWSVVLLDG